VSLRSDSKGSPSRRHVLAGLGAAACPAGPWAAWAAPTDQPVILTIGGLVAPEAPRRLTLSAIEALGTVGFTTRTPWYADASRFDGIRLDRLTELVGARGTALRVEALNDYAADIPIADLAELRPILATRRNGLPMPVSDKGPLFVVYPFDDLPQARHHAMFARSVWQVRRIDVH
jgi:hypothetical protein